MGAGILGALGENLVFPLACSNLGVDAFNVQTGFQAHVKVGLNDVSAERVLGAHGAVELALRRLVAWETEGEVGLWVPEEVLLLETKPEVVVVVVDGGAAVRSVGAAVGVENLAHDEVSVDAVGVGVDGHRLEHAVRIATVGLQRGRAVKRPHGALSHRAAEIGSDHRLAS